MTDITVFPAYGTALHVPLVFQIKVAGIMPSAPTNRLFNTKTLAAHKQRKLFSLRRLWDRVTHSDKRRCKKAAALKLNQIRDWETESQGSISRMDWD